VIPSGLRLDTDFYFVAFGSALIVALQVVLPVISVDYGLLRAFQEALFVLAPVVTLGCVSVISFVGQKTAVVVAAALALLLLTSLTGLMPQVLGGYPPQLTLNNSGDYYDWFYVSSQEVAAAKWLGTHAPSDSTISADAFSEEILTNYLNLSYSGDIYPTLLLNRGAYVFLDYEQVQLGQATVGESSGLLTYDYPTSFLGTTRDLVYASPDYRIYR
jgi:uncharacterized membrane protein